MKIAILVNGRIRGFDKCYESIFKNVIKDHDVDIFLGHNSKNKDDDLVLFQKIYSEKAKHIEIIDSDIDIDHYEKKYPHNCSKVLNGHNMIYQYYCLYEAFQIMEKYSKDNDVNYDVVIYLRVDFNFITPIPEDLLKECKANTVYVPNFNDHTGLTDCFALGNFATMKKYCSSMSYLEQYYKAGCPFHPESLCLYNVEFHKLDVIRFYLNLHKFM